MRRAKRTYINDLENWELPRLDELEMRVTDEFANKAKAVYLDRELFSEDLYNLFLERLRMLAGVAANEIIEYWIKCFGNGNPGIYPALAMELPYLEKQENVDALTIAYCVDIDERTTMELCRVPLEQVLLRIVASTGKSDDLDMRSKAFAAELRALAARLDNGLEDALPSRLV